MKIKWRISDEFGLRSLVSEKQKWPKNGIPLSCSTRPNLTVPGVDRGCKRQLALKVDDERRNQLCKRRIAVHRWEIQRAIHDIRTTQVSPRDYHHIGSHVFV